MSPTSFSGRGRRYGEGRGSKIRTSKPRACSASATWLPRNPDPPKTIARTLPDPSGAARLKNAGEDVDEPAHLRHGPHGGADVARMGGQPQVRGDRKSTRLNSSHSQISYAVFCLK